MAKGLIANRTELTLLALNTKKHFKADDKVPAEFRLSSRYASVYCNTNISPLGAFLNLFSRTSYFVSRFYVRSFKERLIKELKTGEFDIIQLEGLFMGVYIDVIRAHSNARVVLRAHNIEHFIWARHILNESSLIHRIYLKLQNARLKRFELQTFGRVDAVVPITITDEAEIKKLGCRKPVFSCITGVDISHYIEKLPVPPKNNTIFYFGSMDWLPNQEAVTWFLENCWETIHAAVPAAKLIIAGRGMPLHFFHITRPNVSIVENVENGRVFYQQHQVMIVPLWSGSGLRIKIIEGMAYGKAIVSTSIGAEGIGYTNGKNILIADHREEFAAQVISLLTQPEKRRLLEENAKDYAIREFDNVKVVSGLVDFYQNLTNA
jgi:polysaccharide biosynthesis protein PslH